MTRSASLALTVAIVACGPSVGEVRFAKAQQYRAEMQDLLDVTTAAAKPSYQLGQVDKPDCPPEIWQDCVWKIPVQVAGATEPAFVVELHRTNEHGVMVEVDPGTADDKQADALAYRIYTLGQKFIPPPPPPKFVPKH